MKRGRIVLLAGVVVATGLVLALQFRKAKDESSQPTAWKSQTPDPSGSATASSAGTKPIAEPPIKPEAEKAAEPEISPAMSSALAELDRQVFPLGNSKPRPAAGEQPFSTWTSTLTAELAEPDSSERSHEIADGDTLIRLAERYLGSADRSQEIFQFNRDVLSSPDVLPIGKQLRIPPRVPVVSTDHLSKPDVAVTAPPAPPAPLALPATDKPATHPKSPAAASAKPAAKPRTYEVQAGDNLVDIARKLYGDGRRHEQLFEANRAILRNPASLKPGMVLAVP